MTEFRVHLSREQTEQARGRMVTTCCPFCEAMIDATADKALNGPDAFKAAFDEHAPR